MSTALDCGGQGNDHNHRGEEPLELPPPEDQAADDPAVPDPLPVEDDGDEIASVANLVPEAEEPDRPMTPPGQEQDLGFESIYEPDCGSDGQAPQENSGVSGGAQATCCPGHLLTMLLKIGIPAQLTEHMFPTL